MSSKRIGKNILKCEVTNVSPFGVWIIFQNEEFFLSHSDYPWFKKARVEEVLEVQALSKNHLYWPRLDIDIHVESLRNPKMYPLVAQASGFRNTLDSTSHRRRKSA